MQTDLIMEVADVRARLETAIGATIQERERLRNLCVLMTDTLYRVRRNGQALGGGAMARGVCDAKLALLTPREIEVTRLIAEGKSTKDIAYILNLKFKTVVAHRTHILRKLELHESVSLTRLAIRSGLVRP